jgi:hypothetical protein
MFYMHCDLTPTPLQRRGAKPLNKDLHTPFPKKATVPFQTVSVQSFQSAKSWFYSLLKLFTGFAIAALMV